MMAEVLFPAGQRSNVQDVTTGRVVRARWSRAAWIRGARPEGEGRREGSGGDRPRATRDRTASRPRSADSAVRCPRGGRAGRPSTPGRSDGVFRAHPGSPCRRGRNADVRPARDQRGSPPPNRAVRPPRVGFVPCRRPRSGLPKAGRAAHEPPVGDRQAGWPGLRANRVPSRKTRSRTLFVPKHEQLRGRSSHRLEAGPARLRCPTAGRPKKTAAVVDLPRRTAGPHSVGSMSTSPTWASRYSTA